MNEGITEREKEIQTGEEVSKEVLEINKEKEEMSENRIKFSHQKRKRKKKISPKRKKREKNKEIKTRSKRSENVPKKDEKKAVYASGPIIFHLLLNLSRSFWKFIQAEFSETVSSNVFSNRKVIFRLRQGLSTIGKQIFTRFPSGRTDSLPFAASYTCQSRAGGHTIQMLCLTSG